MTFHVVMLQVRTIHAEAEKRAAAKKANQPDVAPPPGYQTTASSEQFMDISAITGVKRAPPPRPEPATSKSAPSTSAAASSGAAARANGGATRSAQARSFWSEREQLVRGHVPKPPKGRNGNPG